VINLAWDHNSYYHERLLRALPARCGRALDVGCGAGEFAARLAERADQVDALDRSTAMIAEARRTVPANVTCLLGDAAAADLPGGAYGDVPAARGTAPDAGPEPGTDPPAGPRPGRGGPAGIPGAVAGPLAVRAHLAQAGRVITGRVRRAP
jgi:SAM-dependent methyltransferase